MHALPAVLQLLFSATQVVPLHLPLQHAPVPPSFEQACPSDVHCAEAHVPLAPQVSEQQSVGALHGVPWAKHLPTAEPQALVLGSQMPEQHVIPLEHTWPKMPHDTGPSTETSIPIDASPEVPPAAPPDPSWPVAPPAPEAPLPVAPAEPPAETSSVDPSSVEPSALAPPAPVPLAPSAPTPLPARPPDPTPAEPARPPPAPESDAEASPDEPPSPKMGVAASSPPHAEMPNTHRSPAPKMFLTFIGCRPP